MGPTSRYRSILEKGGERVARPSAFAWLTWGMCNPSFRPPDLLRQMIANIGFCGRFGSPLTEISHFLPVKIGSVTVARSSG